MLRTISIAVSVAVLSSSVVAAPQRQLVAPELNPALRTVPSIPHSYVVGTDDASCERQLVARIDSGTVIPGPDGRVAHITGMAEGATDATLVITSISADGLMATADFLACTSQSSLTPAPVTAIMPVADARLQSIAVRTRTNTLTVNTR